MTLRKKVKVDGNNQIVEANEDRLIVNVSTQRLGRVELNNELRLHPLSDLGVAQLFKLDHTGLFLLAVHYAIAMNKDPEAPDSSCRVRICGRFVRASPGPGAKERARHDRPRACREERPGTGTGPGTHRFRTDGQESHRCAAQSGGRQDQGRLRTGQFHESD